MSHRIASRWLQHPAVAELLQREQNGLIHTLTEILQQAEMWRDTARRVMRNLPRLQELLDGLQSVVLTGSGSSEYAAECARTAFQQRLQITAQSIGAGALLTDGVALLPRSRPSLMIHFARSGDSPESFAAFLEVLHAAPEMRHLATTCNAQGRLAQAAGSGLPMQSLLLDPQTNDRSLVMTSSFTSMVVAAYGLACYAGAAEYHAIVETLATAADAVLADAFEQFSSVAGKDFARVFYLAGPSIFGAAREAALKMTEMTAGRVMTVAETWLGLRHGPMSAVNSETLVVCFLSSNPLARAYEEDVLRELNTKKLGAGKVLIGSSIPRDLMLEGDVAVEHTGFAEVTDTFAAVLHVAAGQVLAFYRCLREGLKPDAPSETGVINRVVLPFQLHGNAAQGNG